MARSALQHAFAAAKKRALGIGLWVGGVMSWQWASMWARRIAIVTVRSKPLVWSSMRFLIGAVSKCSCAQSDAILAAASAVGLTMTSLAVRLCSAMSSAVACPLVLIACKWLVGSWVHRSMLVPFVMFVSLRAPVVTYDASMKTPWFVGTEGWHTSLLRTTNPHVSARGTVCLPGTVAKPEAVTGRLSIQRRAARPVPALRSEGMEDVGPPLPSDP